jgi:hypothetical protein
MRCKSFFSTNRLHLRRVRWQHLHLNRSITLSKRASRGAYSLVALADLFLACRDINLLQRTLEDFQRSKRLVERYFVARLVDAQEGEETRLLDLAVDNVVAGGDVGEAGIAVAWSADLVGDNLSSEPVAVVVTVHLISMLVLMARE